MPFRDLVDELLDFVDDVVDELGSPQGGRGSTLDPRERDGRRPPAPRVRGDGGDLKQVVDYICEETTSGLPLPVPQARAASNSH